MGKLLTNLLRSIADWGGEQAISRSNGLQRMRYIVYGAGAVGGLVAGRLLEQGFDVVVIARGDHLAAMQRSGLAIESANGLVRVPVVAVAHPSDINFQPSTDVAFLTTKTQDSAEALDELWRNAGPKIPVVCLQNGVEGARLALRRFEHVAGAMMILAAAHLQPGIVQSFLAPVAGVIDLGRFPAGQLAG